MSAAPLLLLTGRAPDGPLHRGGVWVEPKRNFSVAIYVSSHNGVMRLEGRNGTIYLISGTIYLIFSWDLMSDHRTSDKKIWTDDSVTAGHLQTAAHSLTTSQQCLVV